MNKVKKQIDGTEKNKFDINDLTKRDDSIDPTNNDHLLQGLAAYMNAEHIYRNAPKIVRRAEMENENSTPLLDYFTSIQSQSLIPKGMGFVKTRDSERPECLNFKSFYIRKEQANSIAAGLQVTKHVKKMKFRNCGLTDEIFQTIFKEVDLYTLKELDLSYNHLLT